MIDVKIIAKAKSGDSASSSSTVVVQKSAVADEATRAARADFADAANKAGYADLSGYADRAGTAEVAYGLTDDNIIKDQFLSKVIDDTAAGNITFSQDIAVVGDASIGGDVAVTGDVSADNVEANAADIDDIITESVKTATFDADPLVGVGFGIYVDTQLNNATKAVVDYLTVRKGMKVAVLEIAEYRSVNGGLVLSPANGVIESVDAGDAAATVYTIYLKERNMFIAGDLIRCQRWDYEHYPNDPIRYYWVAVDYSNVNDCYIEVVKTEFNTGVTPQADDVLVLMGNTSDTTRQGFVLITIDGMAVYNGVNSKSYTGKLKSKFGDLSGLTFNGNSLSGYGLFGNSVYLSGKFLLENTTGGTTTYVDIDSELGTITSEISDINDDLTEMHSEIVQTAEEISMSVVESVVNGESENLFETPVADFTLNRSQQFPGSQRFFNPLSAFEISEHLTQGNYYTIVMRAKLGTAWTGFQIAPESYSYTSFELTAEEKGDWATITRTFCHAVASPSFQSVYIRLTGAEVTDAHTEAELQSIYLYKGDGVVGSLKRTGIDIKTGLIVLQAATVKVKDTNGDETLIFNATDGTLRTNLIRVSELDATKIDTNHLIARDSNNYVKATVNADFVNGTLMQTNDGAYRIYYPSSGSQNTAKKLELLDVNRGTPQDPYWTTLRMFESDGQTIAWELGTDAMTNGFTNPNFTLVNIAKNVNTDTAAKVAVNFDSQVCKWNETSGTLVAVSGSSISTSNAYYEAEYTASKTMWDETIQQYITLTGQTLYSRRKWTYNSSTTKWEIDTITWLVTDDTPDQNARTS